MLADGTLLRGCAGTPSWWVWGVGRGVCPTDAGLEGRERVASEPSGAERGPQGVQVGSKASGRPASGVSGHGTC